MLHRYMKPGPTETRLTTPKASLRDQLALVRHILLSGNCQKIQVLRGLLESGAIAELDPKVQAAIREGLRKNRGNVEGVLEYWDRHVATE